MNAYRHTFAAIALLAAACSSSLNGQNDGTDGGAGSAGSAGSAIAGGAGSAIAGGAGSAIAGGAGGAVAGGAGSGGAGSAGAPDGGRDATLLTEPDGALSCDNCSTHLGAARSLECYCQVFECPGTLAEALNAGNCTGPGPCKFPRPWQVEERGCGMVLIQFTFGAGDGVALVFDAATEKLVGGQTWTDYTLKAGCLRPNTLDYEGAAQGGVCAGWHWTYGLSLQAVGCADTTRCDLMPVADAGWDSGARFCADAGSRDGSTD